MIILTVAAENLESSDQSANPIFACIKRVNQNGAMQYATMATQVFIFY